MEARLPTDVQHQLKGVVNQLADEFARALPREVVESRAHAKLVEFGDARVVVFLPVLVYRYVREELRANAS